MLYDHERYGKLPIGKWTNIRVEDNKLLADAEFDEEDDFAKQISRKVEKGYLRGASIGFDVIKLSEDKNDLKPGQHRATVTGSEVFEASVTALPANSKALKLRYNGRMLQLNDSSDEQIDSILQLHKPENMSELAKALGLEAEASEDQVKAAALALIAERDELQKNLSKTFVALGKSTGAITDKNQDKMEKLAKADFDLALSFVETEQKEDKSGEESQEKEKGEKKQETLRVSDLIAELRKGTEAGTGSQEDKETFEYLSKNDPEKLEKIRVNEPEKFQKLADEYAKQKSK